MIASKILGLARDLGVAVVAEGVGTEEQWRWFAAHGADFAQGCLSSPNPSSPFGEKLTAEG
jgi:EAL domain-containing protein (putative c-di-GMP-specific phosphodiesterase class I)